MKSRFTLKTITNAIAATLLVGSATTSFSQLYNEAGAALEEGSIGQELQMEKPSVADSLSSLDLKTRSNPFKFTVSVREGFDDNVNTTRTNRLGSFYTNVAGGMSYAFGGPRLKLSTNLDGGVALYNNPAVEQVRFNGLWNLAAVYTVSPRLIINATTNTGYYDEPNVQIAGTNASRQGDYISSSTTIGATYQWARRFSTTTSYNFTALYYTDSVNNDNQGNVQQTLAQAFNFMLWPTTTLVGEYRITPTTYFKADLDSLAQYFLVGFDHSFSPRSTWNSRIGAQVNFLHNPVDGDTTYIGPYGETAWTYKYGEKSQAAFTARYGTEASGLTNVSQRQTFRTGLGVTHAFTPRLTATAGTYIGVNYYDQANVESAFFEYVAEATFAFNYQFNRYLSTSCGYRFIGDLAPQNQSREYNRSVVFLGLNTSF